MSPEELQCMKYAELQKLAKRAGIRANQKVDKLIRALNEYYEDEISGQDTSMKDDVETTNDSIDPTDCPSLDSQDMTIRTEGKKRRRTFELEEPTLKGDSTPTVENDQIRMTRLRTSQTPQSEPRDLPVKRLRKDTTEKSPAQHVTTTVQESSPSTRAILDSVSGDCTSAERRQKLLSAIDKKVHLKLASSPSKSRKGQSSQIPRFMGFLTNTKKEEPTSTTPGSKKWNKIHKKEFSKFDSIDVYLEKKQQRKENLSASTKKQKTKSPAVKTPSGVRKSTSKVTEASKVFKPTVMSTKNISFDFSKSGAPKSASKGTETSKIFKPTVISTKNINFDFSKSASESNKTPKAKTTSTPRKPLPTSTKTNNRATPFKFTGNTSLLNSTVTISSSKKAVFDLKASLAKPLTWKPHTGKLQPVDVNAGHNVSSIRSSSTTTTHTKARKVMSRDSASRMRPTQAKNVRRAAQLDRRSNQKYMDMMRRRGLLS